MTKEPKGTPHWNEEGEAPPEARRQAEAEPVTIERMLGEVDQKIRDHGLKDQPAGAGLRLLLETLATQFLGVPR
jgi:hypothetical protein